MPRSTGTRFVLVGLGGFVVQAALLEALTRLTTLDYRAATVLAVEAAVLHNFLWHDRWTWPRERARAGGWPRTMRQRALWQRLSRFHAATALVSVAGNVGLMALFVGVFGWPVLPATAAAVVLLAVVNFRAADRWVFAVPRVRPVVPALALCGLLVPAAPVLAGPPAEAAAAWTQYVARSEGRVARELADGQRFLTADFDPAQREAVRRRVLGGAVVIVGDSVDVPGGLIHHWHGYTFIPDVDLDTLLESITDPTGPRAVQQEDVLEARVLSRTADGLRLFLKLQRSNVVTVAYNTEHDVRYRRHRDGRASSRSTATRIAELDDVGQPSERERGADRDRGFLWRMNSYWRYEAVPGGGVIVELESLTLSRGLPWGMRSVARPVIEHVARESIERTLVSLGERTRGAAQPRRSPAPRPAHVAAPAKARTGAS
jgi:putative flippase GtrA